MAPLQLRNHNVLMDLFCRLVGFGSSLVGLLCYALSLSFKHLFGEWSLWKIFLYILLSLIISSVMLFAKECNLSKSFWLKAHGGFLVLMLTSVYSYFYDKDVSGKPDILSLISCGAFALMSLCMSRQINLGCEVDLLNFFLGCLTIYLMKIHLMLGLVGAAFSYTFIILRSYLESQPKTLPSSLESQPDTGTLTGSGETVVDMPNEEESVADANSGFNSYHSNDPQQLESLHGRKVEVEIEGTSAPGSSRTVENLPRKAQLQEIELERTTKQPNEAIAIVGEENPKPEAASEVINSPVSQVETLTHIAQGQDVELQRTNKQLDGLKGSNNHLFSNGSSTIGNHNVGHNKQSQLGATNGIGSETKKISESRIETEWVEQNEHAVFITLISLPRGAIVLGKQL